MATLQDLYEKMQGYTKMTDELPFPEFNTYYHEVMDCLQKDYQDFDEKQRLIAKGICSIMCMNAQSRAMKKDANRKKFIKMAEKTNFWQDAIKARLIKDGLTEDDMKAREDALWPDDEEDAATTTQNEAADTAIETKDE